MTSEFRNQNEEVSGASRAARRRRCFRLRTFSLLHSAFCLCASAQYSIDQQVIASSGGTRVGGSYRISATLGQPVSHPAVTAGAYELAAGFWSVAVVQVGGAPVLKMTPAGAGYVTLSWTPQATGWVLQETTSLSSPAWVDSPTGDANPVAVPCSGSMRFFRLHKP